MNGNYFEKWQIVAIFNAPEKWQLFLKAPPSNVPTTASVRIPCILCIPWFIFISISFSLEFFLLPPS